MTRISDKRGSVGGYRKKEKRGKLIENKCKRKISEKQKRRKTKNKEQLHNSLFLLFSSIL